MPSRWPTRWCRNSASLTWSPIVCSGDSDTIGSWKIIEMWRPRIRRILRPSGASRTMSTGRLRRARRREQDLARRDRCRAWQDPHDRLRRHGLAGAGFANERQRRAGLDAKRYPIERRNLDAAIVEFDRKVSNLDQPDIGGRCIPRATQQRPSREDGSRLSIWSIKFCPPSKQMCAGRCPPRRCLPAASRGCGSGRSCPEHHENALTAPFRRVRPTCVPRPQNRNGAAATVSGRRGRCESQRRTCAGRVRGAGFVPPG